jgi:hypothetical protein
MTGVGAPWPATGAHRRGREGEGEREGPGARWQGGGREGGAP